MHTDEKFNPCKEYPRHPRAHNQGGVHLKDQAAKVTEVGLSLVKTLGIKIKEGSVLDLLKMSRPAIISNHLTFLQCAAKDWLNTKYLNKAAATSDPVERMKWVVAFFVSGILHNPVDLQNNGPLNPILGETYNAEKQDGTKLYCEQISHHPPVFAYLVIGPNNAYRFYGTGEVEAKLNGFNNILGRRIGKTTIEFADGGKIVYTNPDVRIDGILVGDRRFNYVKTTVFLDKRNKISTEINFQYEHAGSISKLAHGIKHLFVSHNGERKVRDDIEVIIFKYDKDETNMKKEILCEGSGSWLSHLQISSNLMWKMDPYVEDPWLDDIEKCLDSDSMFRTDAKYIRLKSFDAAQREKDNLENRQRYEEKLRKEHKKM